MKNITLFLIVILGVILGMFTKYINQILFFPISSMIFTFGYFFILSFILHKYRFVFALFITFLFLLVFLSLFYYSSISSTIIVSLLYACHLPIVLFAYVLVPFSFLAISADYYSAVNYLPPYLGRGVIIPILLKRELIRERYQIIIKSLYARGVFISGLSHLFKIIYWLFPLSRTTIMEGVETYDYNIMLGSNIRYYKPKKEKIKLSFIDLFLILMIIFMLFIKILL